MPKTAVSDARERVRPSTANFAAAYARWHTLERNTPPPAVALEAAAEKRAAISVAQEAGLITCSFPAENLLELILTMSRVGAESSFEGGEPSSTCRELRKSLTEAVRRVVAPHPPESGRGA
ncbi:hypothetical protein [Alteraurantiacibacter buctensis]|uniref:hypothetical protein n=1 Tax=Alteraurantiacibacter buctensis TaxID=1503981 RepID=UPI001928620F